MAKASYEPEQRLSDLENYGGNPLVIATQTEIARVASEIHFAAGFLKLNADIGDWLTNPLGLIKFYFDTSAVLEKLDSLYVRCIVASEAYFTTEAQIARRFEITTIPELAGFSIRFAEFLGWSFEGNISSTLTTKTELQKAPESISSIIERLDSLSELEIPTVGIDGYTIPGQTSKLYVVTIPGTQEFSFGTGSNPLDMSSNIQAMSGKGVAHSEQAVLKAIEAEGINENDQVIFVGHSQGAMVAANIASQTNGFLVAGVVTFGGPIAQMTLNKNIPVLAIEHKNDPVPNLSGKASPMKPNWVTVQRKAKQEEAEGLFYSHDLASYKNTSVLVDKSTEVGIVRVREKILSLLERTNLGTKSNYEIKRG